MEQQMTAKPMEKLWTREFITITLISLFTFAGFQMLMATLPVYAKSIGGGNISAGLVVGFFVVSAIIIRPFTGYFLDIHGRRGILLLGILIFAACVFSYALLPPLLLLYTLRFIHGFGWGLCSTASSTVATDIIPKARMGEGMGYFGLAGALSMALAPGLGLYIMKHYNFPTLFYASFFMIVIAFVLALTIGYQKAASIKPRFNIIEKSALRPSVVIFFITMTYGAVVTFIALYSGQQGIDNIGLFFTIYAVAMSISRPFCGILSDRIGYNYIVVPGIALIMVAMLILSAATTLPYFLAAGVVYGIGFGATQPALMALAVRSAPPQRRGLANSTFFTGFDLGIGLSAIMWGAISERTGYSTMYLLAVIPAVLALLSYLLLGANRKTNNMEDRSHAV